ncbi:alpha/beta fold hydrolase [Tsukamurella paurometabola]|uniref:Alpha/beta hydrolase fold protein n=1 Tax=Tsukamurella paurometabola (strain ATCC 8368 / DSM 20162 / CCUG 35730 / CIP 100753 / JCM 10117 / KCTC 9821 / NBRC 16120 / NCIMB 702349 / NCTC 13040) TaxID=521096 RepID=D5UQM7_TSUPD|nr:alpha/beta hydrolase [Tsukamurella paurometabola]ADG76860.1 alpha/beta hydrolase fold protein [Tsukamurella paurometabola DSM 20162]
MPRFDVPGAALDTELSDEGGHPVVQLHGLTSSRARDRVLDLDLGRGLSGTRLLRYDARGHGRSTGRTVPEDYRWPALADDLLRLLDACFPGERVHGVGPSMGTGTLLHAAVRDPGRFSGLTLMVPPTAWATRPAKAAEYRIAADAIEERGLSEFLSAAEDVVSPPATNGAPATLPEVTERLLPSVFRGAALSDLPEREALAAIEVPVTLLAWIDDPAHPVSTAETLAELLPRATLTVARTPADVALWPTVLRDDVARTR